MFRHILVPLDGSPRAEQALPVAARIARATGGKITLLRVANQPLTFAPFPAASAWAVEATIDADIEADKQYLERVKSLNTLINIPIETEVMFGHPAASIVTTAESRHFDLIVMCSHGYTGMKRWMLGSVAEKVAHYAAIPVLLLREHWPTLADTPSFGEGPVRALVPLDGSARAKEALAPAAFLVSALSSPAPGTLHLTRVVSLPATEKFTTAEREAMLHKAKQYLSKTREHIHEGHVAAEVAKMPHAITWSVTVNDDIATGIIHAAETGEGIAGASAPERCNVIVMATHGYHGLQRWSMGSVTDRVLRASKLPVMIVRPADMVKKDHDTETHMVIARK